MNLFGKKKTAPTATRATVVPSQLPPNDIDRELAELERWISLPALEANNQNLMKVQSVIDNKLGRVWGKSPSTAEMEDLERELEKLHVEEEAKSQLGRSRGGDKATELRNKMANLIKMIRALDSYKTPETEAQQRKLLDLAKRLGAELQALKRGAKRKRVTRRNRTRSTRRKQAPRSS
jgi:hypothetical protein